MRWRSVNIYIYETGSEKFSILTFLEYHQAYGSFYHMTVECLSVSAAFLYVTRLLNF
mgnify:CR=1 FL=1